jgi:3-hydroxyacyl-CoA dehydrogenase/enoyl-CoA hydratase/3-hydroxybutyryl-CoA epimerase
VLATNTSSLRIEDLRTRLARPERLIGIHFFNPVARMPLVEVVAAEGSDPEMLQRGSAFVRQIDRLPLPVRSAPGFLVNAVLGPYMLEAMRAVDEGLSGETVDEAMLAFGMPMGPIELIDLVGLDVAVAAGRQPCRQCRGAAACLLERFNAGHLGKKSGRGFYAYRPTGRPVKGQAAGGSGPGRRDLADAGVIGTRQAALRADAATRPPDGIVADADLADAGVIFGTGRRRPLHRRTAQLPGGKPAGLMTWSASRSQLDPGQGRGVRRTTSGRSDHRQSDRSGAHPCCN